MRMLRLEIIQLNYQMQELILKVIQGIVAPVLCTQVSKQVNIL